MENINFELEKELKKIKDDDSFVRFIFAYCASLQDRERLLEFIRNVTNDRIEVLLMAQQIGIESGNVEGEFIDED